MGTPSSPAPSAQIFTAAAFLVFLACGAAAQCSFLDIALPANASVVSGIDASFPIAITNHGSTLQPVYLSASSQPDGLSLEFQPVSHYSLGSGEQQTFNLVAHTSGAESGAYSIPVEITTDLGASFCTEQAVVSLNVTPTSSPTPEPLERAIAQIRPADPLQRFPGESAEFSIFVRNGYDEEVTVSLSSADNDFDSSTTFSEKAFRLAKQSAKAVKARIGVPPAAPGGTYNIVLKAVVSTSCCEQEFLLPVTLSVAAPTAALTILEEPLTCVEATQGKTAYFELGFRNDGQTTGPFTVAVKGDQQSASAVSVETPSFELSPGERTFGNVTIRPPESMPAGTYWFTLEARQASFALYSKEYCYDVGGINDVEITKPASAQVRRCETGSFDLTVRNTGTQAARYSTSVPPLRGVSVHTDPAGGFTLSPRQSQKISVILGASCNAPLGTQALLATVYTEQGLSSESMLVTVLPNASSNSLRVTAPTSIAAVRGQDRTFTVSVTNSLDSDAENTAVSVAGVPAEWVKVEAAKTIKAGATADYRVRITPADSGQYKLSFAASSGEITGMQDSELDSEPENRQVDFTYKLLVEEQGGQPTQAVLAVTVTNNGNVDAKGLQLTTDSTQFSVSTDAAIGDLSPGETRQVTAVVVPLQETQAGVLPLTLRSSAGSSQTKAVSLPAMRPEGAAAAFEFPWQVVVIAALLVLIFALLARGGDSKYQV